MVNLVGFPDGARTEDEASEASILLYEALHRMAPLVFVRAKKKHHAHGLCMTIKRDSSY